MCRFLSPSYCALRWQLDNSEAKISSQSYPAAVYLTLQQSKHWNILSLSQADRKYRPALRWCCFQSIPSCWSNWNQTVAQHTWHVLVDRQSHETPLEWSLTIVAARLLLHFLLTQVLKLSVHTDYSQRGNPPLFPTANKSVIKTSERSTNSLQNKSHVAIKNINYSLKFTGSKVKLNLQSVKF